MRTTCLSIVILTIMLIGVTVADTRIQRRGDSTAKTKSWLKGLLSSIFGSSEKKGPPPAENNSTSNTDQSTVSGNQTQQNNNETLNGDQNSANNSAGNTTTPSTNLTITTAPSQSSGNSTTTPQSGNLTTTPHSGNVTTTPQSGNVTTTLQSAQVTSTPSPANTTANAVTGGQNPPTSSSGSAATTANANPSSDNRNKTKQNCFTSISLDKFCILPEAFQVYLNGNKSVEMVYSKMFSNGVITRLADQCPVAEWCLPEDPPSLFSKKMTDFYNSPFCDDGFVQCLTLIAEQYKECPVRKKLVFLANSLSMLCGMKVMKSQISALCFGQTLATLHLTIATEIHIERNPKLDTDFSITDFCNSPKSKMSKYYLCNLERCPDLHLMLNSFYPWAWFLHTRPSPFDLCNYPQPCGAGKTNTTTGTSPPVTKSVTTITMSTSAPGEASTPNNDGHTFFYVVTGDDSTSLLVGVATGTAVALVGMTILICACHKRARRVNGAIYRSGYKKLPNDDDP
ncbi:uncharacterized protein LOC121381260 [Gigantopelta aegis]|uniref:uncharacterized protein LOC121381260 n=1 Tax=Gigantopelta aegis TaxID=1735272 RepID=UPI001B888C5C|nr:uncharacterized protein LOC121381260 [Gigantopelta aegis]